MKPTSFFSCGKVMLTGEYAVLEGATCLSFPSRRGQTLTIGPREKPGLAVTSLEEDGTPWLEATFDAAGHCLVGPPAAHRLEALFQVARTMRGTTDLPSAHLTFQTHFNRSWGLGSSSTLVHLVAQWLEVDAMALFRATDTGSGYDLATALEGKPIYYRLEKNQAHWKAVQVHWPFLDQLWLVPMGMKQKSDAEVKKFKERGPADPNLIRRISDLAARIAEAQTLAEFNDKLARHEAAVGALLGRPPIRQSLHVPPSMEVKSLGAWGGDLVLVTGAAHEVALFSQSNNLGKPQPFSEVVVI